MLVYGMPLFFSLAATGLKAQQGDSRPWLALRLPTTPSHSAPDVPQRGRQLSPGPQPLAVHTRTCGQQGPTKHRLSFPSPTETKTRA